MRKNRDKLLNNKKSIKRFAIKCFIVVLCFVFVWNAINITLGLINYNTNKNLNLGYSVSSDGLITRQSLVNNYRFGFFEAKEKSCGSIAIYNIMKLSGMQPDFAKILREMDFYGSNCFGYLGTLPTSIVWSLRAKGFEANLHLNRANFDKIAKNSDYCIFTYFAFYGGHYRVIVKNESLSSDDTTIYSVYNSNIFSSMQELIEVDKDALLVLISVNKL